MVIVHLYTLAEAAKQLSITTQTLLNWKERGWVNTVKLPNGRYRIPANEIERLNKPQILTDEAEGGEG